MKKPGLTAKAPEAPKGGAKSKTTRRPTKLKPKEEAERIAKEKLKMKEAAEKADGKWAELPKHGDKDFVYYYVKGAKALYAYHIEDKDYYVLSTAGKSDLKWQRQSGFDVHQGRAKALEAYLESKK